MNLIIKGLLTEKQHYYNIYNNLAARATAARCVGTNEKRKIRRAPRIRRNRRQAQRVAVVARRTSSGG